MSINCAEIAEIIDEQLDEISMLSSKLEGLAYILNHERASDEQAGLGVLLGGLAKEALEISQKLESIDSLELKKIV